MKLKKISRGRFFISVAEKQYGAVDRKGDAVCKYDRKVVLKKSIPDPQSQAYEEYTEIKERQILCLLCSDQLDQLRK